MDAKIIILSLIPFFSVGQINLDSIPPAPDYIKKYEEQKIFLYKLYNHPEKVIRVTQDSILYVVGIEKDAIQESLKYLDFKISRWYKGEWVRTNGAYIEIDSTRLMYTPDFEYRPILYLENSFEEWKLKKVLSTYRKHEEYIKSSK